MKNLVKSINWRRGWLSAALGATVAILAGLVLCLVIAATGALSLVEGAGAERGLLERAAALLLVFDRIPVSLAQPGFTAWAPMAGLVLLAGTLVLGTRVATRATGRRSVGLGLQVGAVYFLAVVALSVLGSEQVTFGAQYALGLLSLAVVTLLLGAVAGVLVHEGRTGLPRLGARVPRLWRRAAIEGFRTVAVGIASVVVVGCLVVAFLAWQHPGGAGRVLDLVGTVPDLLLAAVFWLPNVLGDVFLALLGVPVEWHVRALVSTDGQLGLFSGGLLTVLAAIPAILVLRLGYRAAAERPDRSWQAAVTAGAGFAGACWVVAVLAAGQLSVDPFLDFDTDAQPVLGFLLPMVWGVVGSLAGAAIQRRMAHRLRVPGAIGRRPYLRWALPGGVAVAALLSIFLAPLSSPLRSAFAATDSEGKPFVPLSKRSEDKARRLRPTASPPVVRRGLAQLRRAARGGQVVAERDFFGNVGGVLADLPVPDKAGSDPVSKALAVAERHRAALGLNRAEDELRPERVETDRGFRFIRFKQVYRGIPVYRGGLGVTLDRKGRRALGLFNDVFPAVAPPSTSPRVAAAEARATVRRARPGQEPIRAELVVYPEGAAEGARPRRGSTLAWIVDTPTERAVVDAFSGRIADIKSTVLDGRHRRIYNWNGRFPGIRAIFERHNYGRGGDEAVKLFRETGNAYDYFKYAHGRDSWNDGALPFDGGAPIRATANLDLRDLPCPNAFWAPNLTGGQMAFCPGMNTSDVVGHEYTHAITTYENNNSGSVGLNKALMESTSDVFGEEVERWARRNTGQTNDWLIGGDLSSGVKSDLGTPLALRSLRSPGEPGTDPAYTHMSQLPPGCLTNAQAYMASGIPSGAYYRTQKALGEARAAAIWEWAATKIGPLEGFRRMRINTMMAEYIYASGWIPFNEFLKQLNNDSPVSRAWEDVGVSLALPDRICIPLYLLCAARAATSGGLDPAAAPADEVLATLYRIRNEFLPNSAFGAEIVAAYDRHSDRVSQLLMANPGLRTKAGQLLQDLEPALGALADGQGSRHLLTPELAGEVKGFLWDLREADLSSGGGQLAETLEAEERLAGVDSLVGRDFNEISQALDQRLEAATTRLRSVP